MNKLAYEKCLDCSADLYIQTLHSNAGYYVGTFCDSCGPHSRLSSGYYLTRELCDVQTKLHQTHWDNTNRGHSPTTIHI